MHLSGTDIPHSLRHDIRPVRPTYLRDEESAYSPTLYSANAGIKLGLLAFPPTFCLQACTPAIALPLGEPAPTIDWPGRMLPTMMEPRWYRAR